MIELPRPVIDYLVDAVALDRSPAYLEVSREGTLVDWGGAVDTYGLRHLVRGARVEEQVVSLEGLLPADDDGTCLPCVALDSSSPADICVFRRDGRDWVVLLDASPFEVRSRIPQQVANELTLDAPVTGGAASGASLLSSLFGALDLVVLERQDDGAFTLVSGVTSWWLALFPEARPGATGLRPQELLHFLANFLVDADAFWRLRVEGAPLRSGPWQETSTLSETDWLEATALSLQGKSLLILAGPLAIPADRQTFLQSGRMKSLEVAAHLRTEAGLQLVKKGLEADALRRTADLAEANRRLERELAERRATEARVRMLAHSLESIAEMVSVTDSEDRFTFVNKSFLDCYGYTEDEVIGQHVSVVWSSKNPPALTQEILRETRRGGWSGELDNTRKDRSEFPIYLSTSQVKDDSGQVSGLVGVCRDITEQRQTQEAMRQVEDQFRQAQKMEAVGRLAGGVAHDFNNLLTVMNGYTEIALASMSPSDPVAADILQVKRAGERAAALTGQLLTFSRKQIIAPRTIDLNDVTASTATLLQRVLGEDVHLRIELNAAPALIRADRAQTEQIIMNLAVNARDAMPHGGVLTVEVSSVEFEAGVPNRFDVQPGKYATLGVADTGTGMAEETRSRVFEPFFTTKSEGLGTGLGLSMVYGIVRQSGGGIVVDSSPGQGSRFTVCLPWSVDDRPVVDATPVAGMESRRHEVVLLVEDEDAVRNLVRTLLEADGHVVLEARSGEDAIKLSRKHSGPIHLLLTDTVMPGMNGCDLAGRLAPRRPEMKVLYMSGYPDDVMLRYQVQDRGAAFLQKPFERHVLARKVREVLDAT
ncbi:MAG TPA: PAS domain S-box protein [Vicinamibacterales bacterium]|jgi:hypothetical protein